MKKGVLFMFLGVIGSAALVLLNQDDLAAGRRPRAIASGGTSAHLRAAMKSFDKAKQKADSFLSNIASATSGDGQGLEKIVSLAMNSSTKVKSAAQEYLGSISTSNITAMENAVKKQHVKRSAVIKKGVEIEPEVVGVAPNIAGPMVDYLTAIKKYGQGSAVSAAETALSNLQSAAASTPGLQEVLSGTSGYRLKY